METLRVSIIQTALHWEDTEANLQHFSAKLEHIAGSDLIVLPEMFTTGFSIEREAIAEEHGGRGLQWMLQKAKEKNSVITGSIAVKDKGKLYNRLYWAKPDGTYAQYDKRHLFSLAGEEKHFTPGTQKIIMELKGWKICPLICYDLRFPVWARNNWNDKGEAAYDVLLYAANWPEVRSWPWKQLLIARAIENQAYVLGCNRIGEDGNKFPHSGDSAILNPRGESLADAAPHEDAIITADLSYEYLQEFRRQFPVGMDADPFRLS